MRRTFATPSSHSSPANLVPVAITVAAADNDRAALVERYEERVYEPRPYLYRWLGEDTEELEAELVAAGTIQPVGFRWVGVRRSSR